MAFVLLLIFSSILSAFICKVSTSISTNIGVAPHCNTDDKAVPKFKHGTIISSFFEI